MGDPKYEIVSNENNLVATQDVFRNRFTHLCYELYHYPLAFYWYLVVCITLSTTVVKLYWYDDDSLFTALLIIFSITMCLTAFVPLAVYSQPIFNIDSKLKFCNEIITNKPNLDMDSWSIISQNMNNFLYENEYWPTPFYFYNGKSAYNCFRTIILRRYLGIPKSSTDQVSNELPTIGNSTGNTATPADTSAYFEDYDIDRYMRKARDVYNQSVDSYLKAKYPDYDV